ncbi:translation initiation factor IF-2 [Triticum aestivum]|uniref:translation initiation factor IF-2 n=1 Tax=Triticum aestivum TaxID=4565 RepID=UPI001D0159BA|nr:translation initiation factor IF-2-like [Triticum aestivum]
MWGMFLPTKPALLVVLLRQNPQLRCSPPPSLPRSPAAAALLPAAAAPLLPRSLAAAASCSGAAAAARLPPQAPRFLIKIFDFPSLSSTTHAPPEEEGTEVGAPANLHNLQRPTPSPAPCNWSCQYAASAAGECPPQGLRLAPLLRRSLAVPGPLPGRQGRAAPRLLQPGAATRHAGSGPLLRPIPVLLACSAELCRPRLAVNKLQAGWDKGQLASSRR